MRTGTHYFPRGIAAIERNRQKFGLNKIEETAGESANIASSANIVDTSSAGNHRRSESCDLRRERSTGTQATATVANVLSGGGSTHSMDLTKMFQTSQMSPDPQRHLGYRSYRGFECMCCSEFVDMYQ